MKIYEIIMEARAESLATKYKDKILDRAKSDRQSVVSDEKDILSFVQNLESKFKRYVEWVLLRWLSGNFLIEDMPRVEAAIAEFDAKKRGLERKDINQYRTLSDLEDAVGLLDHIKSARQQKQEVKHAGLRKIVDNDRVLLVHVKTEEAAILIGRGTSWCTAYTNRDNHFNHYDRGGPIYVLIDKSTNEKFQIHYESLQVMDSYDKAYDYQKLLKIAPQLKQIEPEYSDELVKNLHDYGNTLIDYIRVFHNGKRWTEAEPIIMKDPEAASYYARDVIGDRWPEAEPHILKAPDWRLLYAKMVINGRWPEAEPIILKELDSDAIMFYLKYIIRGRWAEAEDILRQDSKVWEIYKRRFGIEE